jgi:cytochrome c-type biogenesis protein CcmH/NrfF
MKRLLLTLAIYASVIFLMGADDDARYKDVGNKIMCSCSCNQVLLQCNHVGCPNSAGMIKELKVQLKASSSDADVLNWFRRTYGYTMVMEPKSEGFEGIIWIVPRVVWVLMFMGAVYLIFLWTSRSKPVLAAAGSKGAGPATDPKLDAFRERARQETEL